VFSPEFVDTLWPFLTAGAAGNDDPRISPSADLVASLPCRRVLVGVAAKDVVRDRGCRYAAWLRRGERRRQVTLLESKGKDHGLHLYRPGCASAVALMDRGARNWKETGCGRQISAGTGSSARLDMKKM